MMKKILSLIIVVCTVFSMVFCANAIDENNLHIIDILGSRNVIYVEFDSALSVDSVKITEIDGTLADCTFSYRQEDNKLIIEPKKSLNLDEKYLITISGDNNTYSKYISFERLYENDFSIGNENNDLIQSGTWSNKPIWSIVSLDNESYFKRESVLPTYPTYFKNYTNDYNQFPSSQEWKNYTVEYDYIGSRNNLTAYNYNDYMKTYFYVKNGNLITMDSEGFKNYCSAMVGSYGETRIATNSMTADTPGAVINQSTHEAKYISCSPVDSYEKDNLSEFKPALEKNVRFTSSIFDGDIYSGVIDISNESIIYKSRYEVDNSDFVSQSGGFAICAYSGPNDWNILDPAYIDNLVCYKLVSKDVEYNADINSNAKDIYNVNEINFSWNYLLGEFDESNITITVDNDTYDDFTVNSKINAETGNSMSKIIFGEELQPEKHIRISFKDVLDSDGNSLTPPDFSFTTSGIYRSISLQCKKNMYASDSTDITVTGFTDNNAYTLDNSLLSFSSTDENVIAVDENGHITATGTGTATIRVSYDYIIAGTILEDELNVTVVKRPVKISRINGSSKVIEVFFDGIISPLEVSITDSNNEIINCTDFSYDSSSNMLLIRPDSCLDIEKKYVLDIMSEKGEFIKNISFEKLYSDDFSDYNKTNERFDNFFYDEENTWTVEDGMLKRNICPFYATRLKGTYEGVSSWQDYTVEYDYINKLTENKNVKFAVAFYSSNCGWNTALSENTSNYGSMVYNDGYAYYYDGTQATKTQMTTKKSTTELSAEDNARVCASLFGKNIYLNVDSENKANKEIKELYSASGVLPVLNKTCGAFSFLSMITDKEDTYMDNLVCYKLVGRDVEYTSDIKNNSRDLYNVNELNLSWNFKLKDFNSSNVIIKQDEEIYTDFTLTDSEDELTGNTNSKITFNTPLKQEKNIVINFVNVQDENSNLIQPPVFSFFTGGIYKSIDVKLDNILSIGETKKISVTGYTENNKYTIDATELKLESDNEECVGVDENGNVKALKRGSANISVSFTDKNTSAIFEKTIPVFVYVNKSGSYTYAGEGKKKILDMANDKFLISSKFEDDISKNTVLGFLDKNVFMSDDENYIIGSETVKRTVGKHLLSVYKDSDKLKVYLDNDLISEEKYINSDVSIYADGNNAQNIDIFNIIGSCCNCDFVNIRSVTGGYEGDYKYSDDDNDIEKDSLYKWFISSSQNGTYSAIDSQNGKTLLSNSLYYGKYLKFEVVPKNEYESGSAVMSSAFYVSAPINNNGGGGGSSSGGGSSILIPSSSEKTPITEEKNEIGYIDVDSNHWAYNSIMKLSKKNILNGFEDKSFKPQKNVTRAEFVCALIKLMDISPKPYENVFSDITEDKWYAQYIQAAFDKEYIKGDGKEFYPDSYITRQEIAVMTERTQNFSESGEPDFSDIDDISDWAKNAVSKLCKKGIINGRSNKIFAPFEYATRAEMATIFDRILSLEEQK